MRVGLICPIEPGRHTARQLTRDAQDAEAAGLDLLWLAGPPGTDPLVAAAFLAAGTTAVRLAACAPVGCHPVHLAEQAAVADQIANGRVILVLHEDAEDPARLIETAEVVRHAAAGRPFRHRGLHWTIPAPAADGAQALLSVTPSPAQLELPIWLAGRAAPAAARVLGLSHVSEAACEAAAARAAWSATAAALGAPAIHLRRAALRSVTCDGDGDFDDVELAANLAAERESWGLDVVLLQLPAGQTALARSRAIGRIGARVRPRLQMASLPAQLASAWASAPLPARA
jgi:alkanesulfonate monooxygenase SsuD/methylene tetrahydromethanopterin reductase-like flavin-dependent oxidoreductase (luciferase family)